MKIDSTYRHLGAAGHCECIYDERGDEPALIVSGATLTPDEARKLRALVSVFLANCDDCGNLPPLSPRQYEMLRHIEVSIEVDGYPPTIREMAEHFGMTSTNGINDHLRALTRKGYIERDTAHAGRNLRVLHGAAAARVTKGGRDTGAPVNVREVQAHG